MGEMQIRGQSQEVRNMHRNQSFTYKENAINKDVCVGAYQKHILLS